MVRAALKDNWLPLTLLAIMAALSVYAWPLVPETLPVHWGLSGESDRWAGRLQGLWLLPLITAGVFALDQPPVLLAAIIGAMLLALVLLSVRSYLIWLGEASSQAQ